MSLFYAKQKFWRGTVKILSLALLFVSRKAESTAISCKFSKPFVRVLFQCKLCNTGAVVQWILCVGSFIGTWNKIFSVFCALWILDTLVFVTTTQLLLVAVYYITKFLPVSSIHRVLRSNGFFLLSILLLIPACYSIELWTPKNCTHTSCSSDLLCRGRRF